MHRTDYQTNSILTQDTVYVQYRKTGKAPNVSYPHTHCGYEIYYFQNGEANYIIGDKIYSLSPGDMLVFRGDIMHLVKPSLRVPYLRSVVNFRVEDMVHELHPSIQEKMSILFETSGGERIQFSEQERCEIEHLFFCMAQEQRRRELGYKDVIRSLLTVLIARILRKYEDTLSRRPAVQFVGQREANIQHVLRILNERFHNRLSLEELAVQVHLNKHYLCHCFKQVTGLTINQYRTKLRIEEGKRLLTESNKPIGVIAEEVGVGVTQFSRLFRQHVGVSPQAYRHR
ncbi:AraC family transcriptional regulator [Alicyclobacillus fastidiosus]|uniref:AraC family transcriptional regulator n=1 Tax=Alicyclobacillus fastidiosus TaxID=392011 RepID=A0ABY6ZMC3_9BACL|nr:AraC family transcriptional regulator [Alicyclobacillus fastidiosus]WAH43115.1 AraC family transcriptional regulator [Alicyclobacillus fastidiosus]GMA65116.1 hypothetical protein GCM10025859_55560 [Alicyclobacillus fastidiosus]